MFPVASVKMRRSMIVVVHGDNDTKKLANSGHGLLISMEADKFGIGHYVISGVG